MVVSASHMPVLNVSFLKARGFGAIGRMTWESDTHVDVETLFRCALIVRKYVSHLGTKAIVPFGSGTHRRIQTEFEWVTSLAMSNEDEKLETTSRPSPAASDERASVQLLSPPLFRWV
jgi:hypothetical protein